ncbi:MAG: hypothetical protein FWG80_00905 [Alphaproteobacteria bacterium]|nr:hypothetical protein [Alphaproteobacteria bacterium]
MNNITLIDILIIIGFAGALFSPYEDGMLIGGGAFAALLVVKLGVWLFSKYKPVLGKAGKKK